MNETLPQIETELFQ